MLFILIGSMEAFGAAAATTEKIMALVGNRLVNCSPLIVDRLILLTPLTFDLPPLTCNLLT